MSNAAQYHVELQNFKKIKNRMLEIRNTIQKVRLGLEGNMNFSFRNVPQTIDAPITIAISGMKTIEYAEWAGLDDFAKTLSQYHNTRHNLLTLWNQMGGKSSGFEHPDA